MQLASFLLSVVPLLQTALAHGSIDWIKTPSGAVYNGASPYNSNPSPMWRAQNGDNGFVASPTSSDIACHKSATAAEQSIPVKAGDTLQLHWSNNFNHPGPVLSYLSPYASTTAGLKFTKIAESGVLATSPVWASLVVVNNNSTANVKIPTNLSTGKYVLRHEIIALHSASQSGGAQFYPFCLTLDITGSGSALPAGTAPTSLYKATDPGILVNIYNPEIKAGSAYTIPGPAVGRS